MDEIKKIEVAYNSYLAKVEAYALVYFAREVRPVFKRHGVWFSQGMGSYSTYNAKTGRVLDLSTVPNFRQLIEDLDTLIPGCNNCFAEFMPDYNPNTEE